MDSLSNGFKVFFILVIVVISSLTLIFMTIPYGRAQSGTNESGLISSDTTWTLVNSPYNLTNSVTVAPGVMLTIEPGTVINLNSFSLQINGTLNARGTNNKPINFNEGFPATAGEETMLRLDFGYEIVFSPSSTSWNPQSQTGSIIENAVIQILVVNGGSPKISNSSLVNIDVFEGSADISNNIIVGGIGVYSGPISIVNNVISQQTHYFWAVIAQRYDRNNAVVLMGDNASGVIENNIIVGTISQVGAGIGFGIETSLRNCSANIVNNTIFGFRGGGVAFADGSGNVVITDNIIHDCGTGIEINGTGANEGTANLTVATRIQRNIISNNGNGIDSTLPSTIQNNTITNNRIAIVTSAPLTLSYNNFEGNNQNVYLAFSNSLDATNNWWGTTNMQTISQSIYDYKNNQNLGNATFTPFLMSPNPQAMPNPSPTPTVPEFPVLTIPLLLIIMVASGLLVYFKKRHL